MAIKNKYRNKKVVVDGIKFDSKLESEIYTWLKIFKKTVNYNYLQLQPRYNLLEGFLINNRRIRKIDYVADFEIYHFGEVYTLDVKGIETEIFKIKEKLFMKKYGREIIKIKSVNDVKVFIADLQKKEREKENKNE